MNKSEMDENNTVSSGTFAFKMLSQGALPAML
jgi:hypothetical protein